MVRSRSRKEDLTLELLAERYPRLFHMAEAGSWPSIQEHGLLSTTALLDLFEVTGPRRGEIEARRRPETIRIEHPIHGTAYIRDNKPINETVLARTLEGMTLEEWYRTLNGRVFFWLTEQRLDRLRNAGPYRRRQHDILTIDTTTLLERHGDRVELAHLNTGAVHPSADYPRGAGTFRPIDQYPWAQRRRISPGEPVVELTVAYSVPDIRDVVVEVETR
ncbi:MAG TPA: hypothetical protein VF520_00855 [Thermoleophilaceae bacterium]|jgi:hypothetical protein